jgi:hypothetical protein
MPLCLCLDKTAVSFLGIFLGLLGTAGMLKGQMKFEMQEKDGKYRLVHEYDDDPKLIKRDLFMYKYGVWFLLISFIVQLLAILL